MATPAANRWSQTIHARLQSMLTRAQLAAWARSQQGVTSVEYILIVAVVAVVVFAAIKGFFGAVADQFDRLTKTVSGG